MNISEKYTTKTINESSSPGCWNTLIVEIYQKQEDGLQIKIGEYNRNYHSLMDTFCPFLKDGKEYALHSFYYTSTAIMELPSCKMICKEEDMANGFCPVDYFVPYEPEAGLNGHFGFVSGCCWGDDTSWKIQYLDLSKIEEGIFTRSEKFGYLPIHSGLRLKDAVDMSNYFIEPITITNPDGTKKTNFDDTTIKIATGLEFDLKKDYCERNYQNEIIKLNR